MIKFDREEALKSSRHFIFPDTVDLEQFTDLFENKK